VRREKRIDVGGLEEKSERDGPPSENGSGEGKGQMREKENGPRLCEARSF